MVEHNAIEAINKADIMANMYNTLDLCDMYHATEEGLQTIYNEWANNKGRADIWNGMSVLDIISKHPDYIADKGYIVKKAEYDRPIDFNVIVHVLDNIRDYAFLLREEVKLEPFSYKEMYCNFANYNSIVDKFWKFDSPESVTYKRMTFNEVVNERDRWRAKCNAISNNSDITINDFETYTTISWERSDKFRSLFSYLITWINNIKNKAERNDETVNQLLIDETVVKWIDESCLCIKGIRVGQSFNKVVGKILTQLGFNTKWEFYNTEIARLGDAASPLKYTRFTVLSANPVDYWRMSFGSSWSSCHTIDKHGNFSASRGGQHYNGIHGSGTESYMLDSSSLIMYTVDKDYNGTEYELQPKINRCMFHVGEGKFVMGRIYPQGKDGEKEVYKQWRNIFQTIIAECLQIPNYWKTEYDRDDKAEQIYTTGTHYADYLESYCDIAGWSWHKPFADSEPSYREIRIGHYPICPSCGCTHEVEDNIECEECNEDGRNRERCECCGGSIDLEDCYETDGNGRYWCSIDCANRSGYYYPADTDDGYVVYEDYLNRDDYDGEYYYYDGEAVEVNGNWYHNAYNAREDGNFEYEDEWYSEDDAEYDALTDEMFPYHADPSSYTTYDANDGSTLFFINDDNKEQWISENENDESDDEESEVA